MGSQRHRQASQLPSREIQLTHSYASCPPSTSRPALSQETCSWIRGSAVILTAPVLVPNRGGQDDRAPSRRDHPDQPRVRRLVAHHTISIGSSVTWPSS